MSQKVSSPSQDLNLSLAKKLNVAAWVVSIAVFLLVVAMRRIKVHTDIDFSFLPPFHASLNGITAIILLFAFYYIKNGNVDRHRKSMTLALGTSVLFLLSYVVYHITTPETSFCFEGSIRYVYFFLLITHVVLAAVMLPFILFTYIRAFTHQYEAHKRMARWVFPFWFYVAITGPVLYLMLAPCYGGGS
jgi:putative membrane protein